MCGICGWVSWDGGAEERVVRDMCARLVHRGPDGAGMWRDPTGVAVLGHRRLRVLDPHSRSDQPMVDPSGAVLSYNGEVYCFRELRRELEGGGRRFATRGDTEVVMAALAERGAEALERLDGMFALALWRPGDGLLLARDRIGIKPLFWARLGGGVAFASELPALLAHPAVHRRPSLAAMARWLQLGYSCGEETLLEGVYRLPPGHLLEAVPEGVRVRPWYDLLGRITAAPPPPPSRAAAAEELELRLRRAVRARLVSDVPLGCFLSGGVDSTVVVSAAVAEGARPETLTVTFAGGQDESAASQRAATALGLEHLLERCSPDEMLEVVASWSRIAGDPLADPSLAPTWVVSRAARRRWTVALSGDGGDELLSGYPRLRLAPRLDLVPQAVRRCGRLLPGSRRWQVKLRDALSADSSWQTYQVLQGLWPADQAAALMGLGEAPPAWPQQLTNRLDGHGRWRRYRLLDALTFLPERVLAKVDRASMAHSLEVRVPILDHRVVELVLSLPLEWTRDKQLLRRVLARLGGPRPGRRKLGFEVPLARWMRGSLRAEIEGELFGSTAADLGLDRALIRQAWDRQQAGEDLSERLFAVAVLTRWVREVVA